MKRLIICSDFYLVVSQVNDNFTARDKGMVLYLKQVIDIFLCENFELVQIQQA